MQQNLQKGKETENKLNTKTTAKFSAPLTGSKYLDLGMTFCTYNEDLLYVHLGFSCGTALPHGTLIAYLPKQVDAVENVGIFGINQGACIISAITLKNNTITAQGTVSQGAYFGDFVLKVKP